MQKSLEIQSSIKNYQLSICAGGLSDFIQRCSNSMFIVDAFFEGKFGLSNSNVIYVAATEKSKSLNCLEDVFRQLRQKKANRTSSLVAIGGGVIQDISTFVSSVYMRGIRWSYVPSTLLGMVDSCLGGKSSINVGEFKNLIGNFYPPDEIFIDPSLVKTQIKKEIAGGLIEAAKICYAGGSEASTRFFALNPDVAMPLHKLETLISESLATKKWFIEIDEFDQKERLLLNYGHTFGHAIESGSNYAISHGQAVALGILVSIEVSQGRGILPLKLPTRLQKFKMFIQQMLEISNMAQPMHLNIEKLFDAFSSDKKHTDTSFRVILPNSTGDLAIFELDKNASTLILVQECFRKAFRFLGWS